MEIKRVWLDNIRSYKEEEITFPSGSVLLSGDIGSGKSTVLLAVEFALFGMQKGSLSGASLLRNGADKGKVKAELKIDSKEIIIERGLKRKKDNVVQDFSFISIDGKKEELSSNELKDKVLKLLNYPSEFLTKNPVLYRYTVYTPQEEMKTILLESAEDRLNTLRRVFGIDRYKRIIENSEKFIVKVRESIKNKEGTLIDFESKKEDCEKRKKETEEIKKEIKKIEALFKEANFDCENKKKKVDEIEEKMKQINRLKTALAVIEANTKNNDLRISQIKDNLSELDSEIKRILGSIKLDHKNIEDLIADNSKLIEKKEQEQEKLDDFAVASGKKIATFEAKKTEIEEMIDEINKLETCPTCKQNVTKDYKKNLLAKTDGEIKNLIEKIKKENEIKEDFCKKFEAVEKELKVLKKKEIELEKAKTSVENLKDKEKVKINLKKELEQTVKEAENGIKKKNDLQKEVEKSKEMDNDYMRAKKVLDDAKQKEKEIEIKKETKAQQFKSAVEIIEMLEKEIKEKEKIKSELLHYNKIKDWINEQFVPLVGMIEKNVLVTLNLEFNSFFEKWFNMLVSGELNARLDENFTPIIEQAGYETNYEHLSGGERTAAALAYRLSLNQVINSLLSNIKTNDLLILDEPTDGFSEQQLDKMKDVLEEIKAKQLILVSHESKIENFVGKIIKFEKKDHTSCIKN